MTKSRHILRPRRLWTKSELRILARDYPNMDTKELAAALGHTVTSVYQAAIKRGLRKSAQATAARKRLEAERLKASGVAHRFQKGIVPWNTGLRRPGWAPGRMRETQFKKGNRPHTWRHPIGSTRLVDGYLYEKVREASPWTKAWKLSHHLLWKRAGRRLRRGQILIFRDGDRTNITIGNLERISMAENARRNHWKRLPKELRELIVLRTTIKRHITMRERYGQQHRDPSRSPVRHAEGSQRQVHGRRPRQGGLRRRRPNHRDRKGGSRLSQCRRRQGLGIHFRRHAAAHG